MKLLYCQIEAQHPNHWAYRNWRAFFLSQGWEVIDFDYEIERIRLGRRGMAEILLKLLRHERPDLVWWGLWEDEFPPELVKQIRDVAPIVGFASDDSWRLEHSLFFGSACTAILTTERDVLPIYGTYGVRAIYCPWAVHPPSYVLPCGEELMYDIVFIGQWLPYRELLVRQLLDLGVSLHVWGKGWLERCPDLDEVGGRVSWEEMLKIYAQAKLVLGMNFDARGNAPCIKARHVEVPACGRVHVVNKDSALRGMFLSPVVQWETVEEAVSVIHEMVSDEKRREELARSGWGEVLERHTWEGRLLPIFRELGIGGSE